MYKVVKISKGLDIKLNGAPAKEMIAVEAAKYYALQPSDFNGMTPKVVVKPEDAVKAGDVLFVDKKCPELRFVSPVSGKVVAVNRGERRRVLSVVVEADGENAAVEYKAKDVPSLSADEVKADLLQAGLFAFIKQRPYDVIASPNDTPRAIFVSAFDSKPLAVDFEVALKGNEADFQTGLDALAKMAPVFLGINSKQNSAALNAAKNVTTTCFDGPHPAGNVGVQINHTAPVNKGEVVWTVNIQDVAIIGRLVKEGKVDMTKTIALAGSEVEAPQYYKMIAGARIDSVVAGKVKAQKEGDSVRIISGNVLTGAKRSESEFVGFYANQLTLIPEGDKFELFGWMMPRFKKFSVSRAYFSWLFPKKQYTLDTNLNGGERPFVVSGIYEQYLPMDIYPVYLLKACLAGDIDKMENLGIYEVVEEDIALCEFVDPSKIEMQQVLRDGINLMIKEA